MGRLLSQGVTMSRTLILFLILSTGSHVLAQEKKQSGVLVRCLEDCDKKNAVEGDLEAGRALVLPKPTYPALARRAKATGQVLVQLLIDVDGTVLNAVAVEGHPLLYAVSVEAAKNSRFSPTKLDGKAVKVTGLISYNFFSY